MLVYSLGIRSLEVDAGGAVRTEVQKETCTCGALDINRGGRSEVGEKKMRAAGHL